MYQIKVESKIVKSGKELKIKGKATKNLEMKSIHSLQGIPSNFDEGVKLIEHNPNFLIMLVKYWY